MPIGDQDHGCVAMPVAAMLACAVHQPLDLALGEIAPFDCQAFGVSAPRLINSLLTVRSGTTRALCRTMSKSIAARFGMTQSLPSSQWIVGPAASNLLTMHPFAWLCFCFSLCWRSCWPSMVLAPLLCPQNAHLLHSLR